MIHSKSFHFIEQTVIKIKRKLEKKIYKFIAYTSLVNFLKKGF